MVRAVFEVFSRRRVKKVLETGQARVEPRNTARLALWASAQGVRRVTIERRKVKEVTVTSLAYTLLMRRIFLLLALVIPISAELTWQKPSKEILDILNAPATPVLSVNPSRTYAALSEAHRNPSITEVSEPMLRLAGLRIDPRTNGLHLAGGSFAITLVKLSDASKIPVALLAKALAGGRPWRPDANHFPFSNTTTPPI